MESIVVVGLCAKFEEVANVDALLTVLFAMFLGKSRLAIYCIVATIYASIKLYKCWGDDDVSIGLWTFLTFVAVILVFIVFVATTNIVVNSFGRSSRVDVTSLALLNEEQISQIESTLLHLSEQGVLYIRDINDYTEGSSISRSYRIRWNDAPRYPNDFSLSSVRIFNSEELAFESVLAMRISPVRRNTNNRYILNDNNTSALLFFPEMPVSSSGLNLPTDRRWVNSEIQIGVLVLRIVEVRPWYNLRPTYTTQFIEMLVEASMSGVENDYEEP